MKILTSVAVLATFLFGAVDINNATVEEFTALKGVGATKAQAIVEHRKNIKCFQAIDDLSQIKGIGPKTVEKNRSELVLGKCKK